MKMDKTYKPGYWQGKFYRSKILWFDLDYIKWTRIIGGILGFIIGLIFIFNYNASENFGISPSSDIFWGVILILAGAFSFYMGIKEIFIWEWQRKKKEAMKKKIKTK